MTSYNQNELSRQQAVAINSKQSPNTLAHSSGGTNNDISSIYDRIKTLRANLSNNFVSSSAPGIYLNSNPEASVASMRLATSGGLNKTGNGSQHGLSSSAALSYSATNAKHMSQSGVQSMNLGTSMALQNSNLRHTMPTQNDVMLIHDIQ